LKKLAYNDQKNVIYQQLKKARLAAGISQGQLAAKMQTFGINIDQQMISKIERNQRIVTDYELASFCIIFGMEEKDLLKELHAHCYEPEPFGPQKPI